MIHKRNRLGLFLAAGAALFSAGSAQAGMMVLGDSGWTASWDDELDAFVSIVVDAEGDDVVFIEKFAEFTEAPVDRVFSSIQIRFEQTSETAASHIVIENEGITNSTGTDWTDFHMELFSEAVAVFDPTMTAASGGGGPIGFSVAPFTIADFADLNRRLDISGGVVDGEGGLWNPGGGAEDGQLWIDVLEGGLGAVFVLDELPTPEPATIALLGLGGVLLRRRGARA